MEALSLLDVKADKPEDANSWIREIHNLLEADSWESSLRSVMRTLADRHTKEELLIFVSIISYGKDVCFRQGCEVCLCESEAVAEG